MIACAIARMAPAVKRLLRGSPSALSRRYPPTDAADQFAHATARLRHAAPHEIRELQRQWTNLFGDLEIMSTGRR
jgi:hypothetical protein